MGREHRGRVRGLGHGVTPSIVQASVVGKQSFTQYQQHVDGEMATMKQTITNLTNLLMTHLPNVDQAQVLACIPPTQSVNDSQHLILLVIAIFWYFECIFIPFLCFQ